MKKQITLFGILALLASVAASPSYAGKTSAISYQITRCSSEQDSLSVVLFVDSMAMLDENAMTQGKGAPGLITRHQITANGAEDGFAIAGKVKLIKNPNDLELSKFTFTGADGYTTMDIQLSRNSDRQIIGTATFDDKVHGQGPRTLSCAFFK